MDKGHIFEETRKFLCETFKLKPEDIKPESKLDQDLGLDSVDIMDCVTLFEEKFRITIFEENSDTSPKIETIQDLIMLIHSKSKF